MEQDETEDEDMGQHQSQSNENATSHAPVPITTAGGRRLGDGGPSAPSATSSSAQPATSSRSKPAQNKKFGTLKDLQTDSHAGHGHGDDDDSDKEQEFYAGGDKSGLAVQDPSQSNQNPSDQIRRLMNTARR